MILENIITCLHYLEKFLAAVFDSGEILTDALTDNIVRTGKIVSVLVGLPHQTMAVAKTCIKMAKIVSKLTVDSLDKLVSLGCGYLIRRIVGYYAILVVILLFSEGNEITSDSSIVILHCKSHTKSLKRRSALGEHLGIEGKNCHICGVALGDHSVGHVGNSSYKRLACKCIHTRLMRLLHWRHTAKRLDLFICHTVRNEN